MRKKTYDKLYLSRKREFDQVQRRLGSLYIDFINDLYEKIPHEMPLKNAVNIFDGEFAKFKQQYG